MTAAKLEAIERAELESLNRWAVDVRRLVWARLLDARAHAEAGRLADATKRIHELRESLKGAVLGPAREEFYRQAFGAAHATLDPELVDKSVVPTAEGAAVARSVPIAGQDHFALLDSVVEAARRGLQIVAASGRREAIGAWQARQAEVIERLVTRLLSDAQVGLREAVARLTTKADVQ
jgi:hypothetical protein